MDFSPKKVVSSLNVLGAISLFNKCIKFMNGKEFGTCILWTNFSHLFYTCIHKNRNSSVFIFDKFSSSGRYNTQHF